jgi:formylglycine-generating enzyme required for sulfatase activity
VFVSCFVSEKTRISSVLLWKERQIKRAEQRAQAIIDFLSEDKNKAVQQLAAVPMLLQIIAIIWKEREVLPQVRAELYQTALRYLLEFRDRHRKLDPLLPASQALRVLTPVCLWMQEDLGADDVAKDALHKRMQPLIKTMDETLEAEDFCINLRDRAGLIAEHGENAYIFRHKSFREYLAASELVKVSAEPGRLAKLIEHFGDDWWDEPLRFFIAEADDKLFDQFMDTLFASPVSRDLDQKQQDLLQTMICEASQVRLDSLCRRLNDGRVHEAKKRYILDCLKAVNRQEARSAIQRFAASHVGTEAGSYAQEISVEILAEAPKPAEVLKAAATFREWPSSFRNFHELNAEYILIRGGSFTYSVTKKSETVPDLYFAKYPVTNRRYRRFTSYLEGKEDGLSEILSLELFSQRMLEFATTIDGFKEYLGDDYGSWAKKLRSSCDEEKHFKGDDQPVVEVSWFDASAYCFWLSMLEASAQGVAIEELGRAYRLPTEIEWEWAAGGGKREYPWAPGKGGPSDKLANYDGNIRATTPVGRYPDGATPEGLMDMAGNVWEWMENWHEDYVGKARSLRGGSWYNDDLLLRCSARVFDLPVYRYVIFGFRVVCSQS